METRLLTAVGPVTDQTARAIRDLVGHCTREAGVAPVSEQPLLWLQDPRAHVAHILAIRENSLVGYAQADLSDPKEVTFELAVSPTDKETGLSRRLLEAGSYVAENNQAAYSVWLHGASTQYVHVFESNGFMAVRTLLRLQADLLSDDSPASSESAAVVQDLAGQHALADLGIRTFQPGQDDEAWVAANAEAFAWHPEQGKLTLADLHARMKESWFDPSLFFVVDGATASGLGGFSWLKAPAGQISGEIYALATVSQARGKGLGKALLTRSLAELRARGFRHADLYVESTNTRALALYRNYGFREVERHVKLTRPASTATTVSPA